MSTTSVLPFTEFEQLPDSPGKRELIDGDLIELPPSKYRHSQVAKRIYDLLLETAHKSATMMEAGYRIGGGWLQPDVSVVWPNQKLVDDYLVGGPMLAVEILSPGNTAEYIERKLTLYLSEGSAEVWLVNPKSKNMTVYRAEEGRVVRIAVESTYSSEPLGLNIDLSSLFS